jgi:hypothetical protein
VVLQRARVPPAVLEGVLYSDSDVLNELELAGGSLLESSSSHSGSTRTNESIKQIKLSCCRIEAPGWSILHGFRGLQTLELISVTSSLYSSSYSDLLLRLPRLEAFSDSSSDLFAGTALENQYSRFFMGSLRRFCQQAILAEFASRMSSAPNVNCRR